MTNRIAPSADMSAVRAWSKDLIENRSSQTRAVYLSAMGRFVSWTESKQISIDQVRGSTLRAFLLDLRSVYSIRSVRVHLAAVRSFYRWATAIGAPFEDPTAGVQISPAAKSEITPRPLENLTDQEIRALIDSCDRENSTRGRRDLAIIYLMAYSRLLRADIHRANISDIDQENGRIILRIKPGRFASVPIYPAVFIPLMNWIRERAKWTGAGGPLFIHLAPRNGGRLSTTSISIMLRRRLAKAGVDSSRRLGGLKKIAAV